MVSIKAYIFLVANSICAAILFALLITLLVDEHPTQLAEWKAKSEAVQYKYLVE